MRLWAVINERKETEMNETIDNQQIINRARTPNMAGSTTALFLTFDGVWYRVRTRFETFTKVKNRQKAELSFSNNLAE
jgi:hypothetical protein